jgi:hypothetical protein
MREVISEIVHDHSENVPSADNPPYVFFLRFHRFVCSRWLSQDGRGVAARI